MTILEYLNLITAAFRDQPNYTAMVEAGSQPYVKIQDVLTEMIPDFDVDLAVGSQLDIIGLWVGISRVVLVPITGVYFTWDDPLLGWEQGIWAPENPGSVVTVLPDDVYRNFIKAKIAANQWDGTTDGMYAVWDAVFTETTILVVDHLNMSYDLAFVGENLDALTIAMITGGYLPLKPEGVRINQYLFPVNDGPIFAWDIENDFLDGWDVGSWPRVVLPS